MSDVKPREWFLVHRFGYTEGWIYNHLDSAEKRLSSGLKQPPDFHEYRIIPVIEKSAYEAIVKERDQLVVAHDTQVMIAQQFQKIFVEIEPEMTKLIEERDELKRQLDEIYNRQNG